MSFLNPSDALEVLYGISGDVRNEINVYISASTAGHYADESEIPGSLIISGLRRATRIINAFLEPVYADQIPFTTVASVPKLLDEIASDVAVFYVWRSAHALMGAVPEDKKQQYFDQYMDSETGLLTLLKDRKLQLPELTSSYADDAKAIRGGYNSVFDLDNDLSQGVDSDLLNNIEKDRS